VDEHGAGKDKTKKSHTATCVMWIMKIIC
jgi:hypothetical protein